MDKEKLPLLKTMYDVVKQNEAYQNRKNKLKVIPPFKKIIWQTLQNEPLTNEHLTGLIHMFKHDCSAENFDKYLAINIKDDDIRNQLSNEAYDADENGFTNAGKRAIQTLDAEQIAFVKKFLQDAFEIGTVEEGVKLCKEFIAKKIPIVTEGIYSPWLFYINPSIFPLVNDGIKGFKSWIRLSKDYDINIEEFNLISKSIGEPNLGLVDALATSITKDGNLNLARTLVLGDKELYKISHGVFLKRPDFAQSGIIKILEQNNWIALSRYTGKGAGEMFEHDVKIGDYVYLCYGGDRVISIAKITSEVKVFNKEHAALLKDEDEEEWIYREIEPIYFPIESDITDLKSFRSQTMPSGNSTFWKIKPSDLETLNENLFIPKFNLEIFKSDEEEADANDDDLGETINILSMTNNSILYGPPGTGKTFHSISYSVAIVENKTIEAVLAEERDLVKKRFDDYVKDGQIVFCTFHQSLSYEDFIEGIKPVEPETEEDELTYAVEDGIFKRLCTEAAFSFTTSNTTQETQELLDITSQYKNYVDWANTQLLKGIPVKIKTKTEIEYSVIEANDKKIVVQKDLHSKERPVTLSKLSKVSKAIPDLNNLDNIHQEFRKYVGGNITVTWAILNAVRGFSNGKGVDRKPQAQFTYEDKKAIIKSLQTDDYKKSNPKRYVLIIDEINRGNVSQIFGELITLIEDDKRLGKDESLTATLPYSKESFGVPDNVFIIGTMNTADRSVEALDTALRRRFSFLPQMPQEDKLGITVEGIDLSKILYTLNYRLRILKDNDHTIGHAWLWQVDDLAKLKSVFSNKILPLLQEYFYNDYEKLGLVLGDRFFRKHVQINGNIFASFSGGNGLAGQYDQSWQYQLKAVHDLTAEDFKSLEQLNRQPDTDEEL